MTEHNAVPPRMNHRIDILLNKLNPPLRPNEHLHVYFYGNKRPVPFRPGIIIHAFATGYVRHEGREENPGAQPIIFSEYVSDSNPDTNHMRAHLGAMLTTLNWLSVNGAEEHPVTIYGKTFVAKDLPTQWPRWIRQTKRPNRDLLEKFELYFGPEGWRYTSWKVTALENADRLQTNHHERLEDLRLRVDAELAIRVGEMTPDDLPTEIGESFEEVSERLFKRALARDRS
jgi:hypothetical protein